jgi:hypothetical protein
MLFNSPEFLLFLPIVFGLYWFGTPKKPIGSFSSEPKANLTREKSAQKKSPTEVGLFWLCKSEEKRLHHASHAAGSSSGSSR